MTTPPRSLDELIFCVNMSKVIKRRLCAMSCYLLYLFQYCWEYRWITSFSFLNEIWCQYHISRKSRRLPCSLVKVCLHIYKRTKKKKLIFALSFAGFCLAYSLIEWKTRCSSSNRYSCDRLSKFAIITLSAVAPWDREHCRDRFFSTVFRISVRWQTSTYKLTSERILNTLLRYFGTLPTSYPAHL